jgi:hypothetical protein
MEQAGTISAGQGARFPAALHGLQGGPGRPVQELRGVILGQILRITSHDWAVEYPVADSAPVGPGLRLGC